MRTVHAAGLAMATALLGAGCTGARINGVRAPHPTECGKLVVECQAKNLYGKGDNRVVAEWAGYRAQALVPLDGSAPVEDRNVELKEWTYVGKTQVPLNRMEVRYEFKGRAIARTRIKPLFGAPDVLGKTCVEDAPAVASAPAPGPAPAPRPAPAPAPGRTTRSLLADGTAPPQGWPRPGDYSATIDAPSRSPLSQEIVCLLSQASGPRYIALEQTPDAVVTLVIDIVSRGAAQFHEVTFWRVELLDEDGLALPHVEEGRVDLGGQRRVTAKWRLDGSPVILKLQSFSQPGDWIRLRFEREGAQPQ